MPQDVQEYLEALDGEYREVCERLQTEISSGLPEAENKVWHRHPVWFLSGNPIVGYSIQKPGVRLMFWSGADFNEPRLKPGTGKFKDASIFYSSVNEIDSNELSRWLSLACTIQWNYKNLIKRQGKLEQVV